MNNMTQLEKVLAAELAKVAVIDVAAIIEAAQACCMGGPAVTVATAPTTIVETPAPKAEKAKAVKATVEKPVEQVKPVETPAPTPAPVVEKPATPAPTVGIDLSGLFTGSGADKKVVKDVFLAAVEQAKTLAHLVALNATCDCGFDTSTYTEDTTPVLRRKLDRWGRAQE